MIAYVFNINTTDLLIIILKKQHRYERIMNHLESVIKYLKEIVPELKSKNIVFRLLENSDLFCLFDGSQNEEFNKNLGWGTPKKEEDLIDIFYNQNKSKDLAIFSVCDKYKGNWIGTIKYEIVRDELMIAIWTHPDYWKTGIAYQISCTGVEILFKYTQEVEINARIKHDNELMKKYVIKNNFKYIRDDKVFHITNKYEFNCWIYKAKKEDWIFKYDIEKIKN